MKRSRFSEVQINRREAASDRALTEVRALHVPLVKMEVCKMQGMRACLCHAREHDIVGFRLRTTNITLIT